MGIRELIESAVGPSLEELRAAGVREVHLQPDAEGGAIGIAGEGFSLLLHAEGAGQPSFAALLGVSDPTPSLAPPAAPEPPQDAPDGAGAFEAAEEGAGSEESRRAPASATEPAHSSAPSNRSAAQKRSVAAADARRRCGERYARHSYSSDGACGRCGAPVPEPGERAVATTRTEAERWQREQAAGTPAPSAGGVQQRHDLQPHNPGRCPRCGRPITKTETPRGARWECDAVPQGCGWREWTWVAA